MNFFEIVVRERLVLPPPAFQVGWQGFSPRVDAPELLPGDRQQYGVFGVYPVLS